MKIGDIAKELANRVNQEHYVLHLLNKVEKCAYDKGVKDAEDRQIILSLGNVVVQSEQLPFDFIVWYSGMEKQKILNSYSRWLKEKGN